MNNIEKLADELKREVAASELKIESFDLALALEKADTQALRSEIENLLKRQAKQVYYDDEYALFVKTMSYYYTASRAAEKYYNAKSGRREYEALWAIGLDKTQKAGFWIHRLAWKDEFEEFKKQNWAGLTKEKIREWMGFAKQPSEAWTARSGEWVRLVGDLRMQLIETKEQHIEREINSAKEDAEAEYVRENCERMIVSEYEIREYQRGQGWKVLSRKRKEEAMRAIQIQKCTHEFQLNKDAIIKKIEAEMRNDIHTNYDELNGFDMRLGNHVIKFENARRNGDWYSERYEIAAFGTMVTIHEEHGTRKYVLPAGRYALSLLPRHITQRR